MVLQERARGVPGGGLGGVGHGRHADHREAAGPGVRGHLDGQHVAPGQGNDDQQVARGGGAVVEDGGGQAADALQRAAQGGGHDVDPGGARHRQQVDQGEAARAVDEVLGREGGVPGAVGEQLAAGGDGAGDQCGPLGYVRGLPFADAVQQADRGVEELVGERDLAHVSCVPLLAVAVRRRFRWGHRKGLDQCGVNTHASGHSRRKRLSPRYVRIGTGPPHETSRGTYVRTHRHDRDVPPHHSGAGGGGRDPDAGPHRRAA